MLVIHNTLTRQKETFKPMMPGKVGIYVCGVTVYDYCHLGHARTYTAMDVVIRYLRFLNYDVHYVRNITDIDDKIIKRANEKGEAYQQVTDRFTKAMHEDFKALGIAPPNDEPRATDYIPDMIALIQHMIAKGHAYVAKNGDVYFDVRSDENYGCLSHHNLEQLESGVRVEVSDVKKDPLDFVLWKLAKPNEPAWDSPWGKGRPGWHIECSAMGMKLLGEQFDLHAGGRDLIFPHHENEIAQSQAASGVIPFVNTWMHAGFLQMEKEKMSKSLGNFITIRDVLKEHDPETLRYFLIASHYRSPLMYTTDSLSQAKQALTRFYTALRYLSVAEAVANSEFETKFKAAMDDDFNTPIALSVLFDLAHEVQRLRDKDPASAAAHASLLKRLGLVLGILQADPEVFFQADAKVDVVQIEKLITERQTARAQKNWAEADRIRHALLEMGIVIEDMQDKTIWKSK